jgi:hypothetical protein
MIMMIVTVHHMHAAANIIMYLSSQPCLNSIGASVSQSVGEVDKLVYSKSASAAMQQTELTN